MRNLVLLAILAVPLAVACNPQPEPFTQAEKDVLAVEVRETLAGLTEAMNNHDPDAVMAYFRQNEEFLYLGCTYSMLGWETFSPRVWSYTVANPQVTFQRDVVRIQVLSPTAAVAMLQGASTEAEALFWTEVLVKEDGAWVIAHEHESWPGCPQPINPHPFTTMEEVSGLGGVDSTGQGGDAPGSGTGGS
ncbi:MAG: nuclear transport factor 2 family protein [Longimicrobiales bacterium]|nr:nuclear transport factor 2 family protein [Longimicrobiales bacterium]